MNPSIKNLLVSLEDSYSVVMRPDHPLLLRGPDALVSDYGNLVAVFSADSRERKNLTSLMVRLGISRYALPAGTRCILLTDGTENTDIGYLKSNFHAVLHNEERGELRSIIRIRGTNLGPSREVPPDLRRKYYNQFWAALELSRRASLGQRRTPALPDPDDAASGELSDFHLRSWGPRGRDTVSKRLRRTADGRSIVGVLRGRRGRVRAEIESFIEYRTRGFYSLDNGILYGNNAAGPSLLMTPAEAPVLWDPMKLARASAFAGWSLVPSAEQPNLSEYGREYGEVVEEVESRPVVRGQEEDFPHGWEDGEEEQ